MDYKNQSIVPFFTFKGNAEEAMNYYIDTLPGGKFVSIRHFGKDERGEEGKVLTGVFEVMGMKMMVMDMSAEYCPDFSWATTMLFSCNTEKEFDQIFDALSKGGSVMMGPESVFELRKVAWVTDQFQVTWQIVWE